MSEPIGTLLRRFLPLPRFEARSLSHPAQLRLKLFTVLTINKLAYSDICFDKTFVAVTSYLRVF